MKMVKTPILKKSFLVKSKHDLDLFWSEVQADSANNAKSQYLKHCDANYCDLQVKRNPPDDIVLFENNIVRRHNMESILLGRNFRIQLEKFKTENAGKNCYIFSEQWEKYWGIEGISSYSPSKEQAQIYTVEQAVKKIMHCGPEKKIKLILV